MHRAKVREEGGSFITLSLDAEALDLLKSIKERWNLPASASKADVIKAMAVVLNGHTLISSQLRVSATVQVESPSDTEEHSSTT